MEGRKSVCLIAYDRGPGNQPCEVGYSKLNHILSFCRGVEVFHVTGGREARALAGRVGDHQRCQQSQRSTRSHGGMPAHNEQPTDGCEF